MKTLIALGIDQKISGNDSVDERTVAEVIASQQPRTATGEDRESIRIFAMPSGWYAQEATFVERENPRDEDDGFLITYVFDEAQLDVDGYPRADAKSELWIIDAWDMSTVVSKILLPQRGEFLRTLPRACADIARQYRTGCTESSSRRSRSKNNDLSSKREGEKIRS